MKFKKVISMLAAISMLSSVIVTNAFAAVTAENPIVMKLTYTEKDISEDDEFVDYAEEYDAYTIKVAIDNYPGNYASKVGTALTYFKFGYSSVQGLKAGEGNDWWISGAGAFANNTYGYGKTPLSTAKRTEGQNGVNLGNATLLVKKDTSMKLIPIIGAVTSVEASGDDVDTSTYKDYAVDNGLLKFDDETAAGFQIGTPTQEAKLDKVVITGENALKMGATETTTLTAKAYDTENKEMSDATFTWAVAEGADVVDVANGVVTAKKAGTAKVTATTTIGEVTKTGEIAITVEQEDAKLATIAVSAESTTVEEGKTLKVTAAGKDQYGADFAIDGVAWTSTNEDVATVENGVVTAKKAGTTTIKATVGEISDKIEITVTAAPIPELEILINGEKGDVAGTQVKNGEDIIGYVWKVLFKNYKAGTYTAKFTSAGYEPKTASINGLPDTEGEPTVSLAVILNTAKGGVTMGIDYAE